MPRTVANTVASAATRSVAAARWIASPGCCSRCSAPDQRLGALPPAGRRDQPRAGTLRTSARADCRRGAAPGSHADRRHDDRRPGRPGRARRAPDPPPSRRPAGTYLVEDGVALSASASSATTARAARARRRLTALACGAMPRDHLPVDYGNDDQFVGVVHGVIRSCAPGARDRRDPRDSAPGRRPRRPRADPGAPYMRLACTWRWSIPRSGRAGARSRCGWPRRVGCSSAPTTGC